MLQAEELLCLQQDLGENEGSCWSHKRLRELPLFCVTVKINPLLCGGREDL